MVTDAIRRHLTFVSNVKCQILTSKINQYKHISAVIGLMSAFSMHVDLGIRFGEIMTVFRIWRSPPDCPHVSFRPCSDDWMDAGWRAGGPAG